MNRRSFVFALCALPFGSNIIVDTEASIMPAKIPGIKDKTCNCKRCSFIKTHIQKLKNPISITRQEIFELGHQRPYFDYAKIME